MPAFYTLYACLYAICLLCLPYHHAVTERRLLYHFPHMPATTIQEEEASSWGGGGTGQGGGGERGMGSCGAQRRRRHQLIVMQEGPAFPACYLPACC